MLLSSRLVVAGSNFTANINYKAKDSYDKVVVAGSNFTANINAYPVRMQQDCVVAGSNFTANINVFTDIQARRIKALMATDNKINLTNAQASATASVAALFGLAPTVDLGALDLTNGSDENNLILLRASAAIAMQPSILSDLQTATATVNANLADSVIGSRGLRDLNNTIGKLNFGSITATIATVSDDNPPTTAALDNLNVAPNITTLTAQVTAEDSPLSINLAASDANGNTLTFSAISLNTSLVTVTTTTGATTNGNTVGTLNFIPQLNQNGTATIVVSAVDSEGARNSIQFVLVVAPVNDAPVANFKVFTSLFSDSATGTVIDSPTEVRAYFTDVDGDTLTYSITSGNGSNTFAINATTGQVTTAVALDEDQVGTYILGITASDGNNGVATTILTVVVNDVNDNTPIITSSNRVTVAENQTFVLKVTSTDADSTGNDNTFSTILAGADAKLFSITSAGVLTFNSAPNFEDDNSAAGNNIYVVVVTATNGTRSSAQTITISVIDATENTTLTINNLEATATVLENTIYTSTTPSATNAMGSLTYSLSVNEASASATFSVNASTGVVTLPAQNFEAPADNDTNNIYNYTLQVTDADGNAATQTVAVTITNVTESATLTITNLADTNIAENTIYTSTTPSVTGDPIGGLTYSLSVNEDSASATFSVNASTGVVTLPVQNFEAPADNGTNNIYNYTLQVTDADGNTATQTVAVTIDNVTEFLTINDLAATATVLENTIYTSTTPSATNAMGSLTYSLSVNEASASATFSVNASTGVVTLPEQNFEAPADNDTNNIYNYTLQVTDADDNTATRTVAVTIDNVNENIITINAQTREIAENSAIGSNVGAILATTGSPSTFTIEDPSSSFTIDNTGQITNLVALDFATTPNYTVIVIITKADARQAGAVITINVSSINENTVTIANQAYTAQENAAFSQTIISSGTLSRSLTIISGNTGNVFTLDSATRFLSANANTLDFETTPTFNLIVQAAVLDAIAKTATITINVNNVAELVTSITITSPSSIVNGSLTLSAEVLPNGAAQTVTWSIQDGSTTTASITGDVITSARIGSVVIIASATDASGVTGTQNFSVIVAPPSTLSAVATGVRNQVRISWAAVPGGG